MHALCQSADHPEKNIKIHLAMEHLYDARNVKCVGPVAVTQGVLDRCTLQHVVKWLVTFD